MVQEEEIQRKYKQPFSFEKQPTAFALLRAFLFLFLFPKRKKMQTNFLAPRETNSYYRSVCTDQYTRYLVLAPPAMLLATIHEICVAAIQQIFTSIYGIRRYCEWMHS